MPAQWSQLIQCRLPLASIDALPLELWVGLIMVLLVGVIAFGGVVRRRWY
jgi:hypothetical protein